MFDLFAELNKQGKTVIFVTHSRSLAEKARTKIEMIDGVITKESVAVA